MAITAPKIPTQQHKKRIVKARDLHWIKWSFSPDRWGFARFDKWYCNTLLAYFCSVINAYTKQGQQCHGVDVPLDWLLDRCFGSTLSKGTLKRALRALDGDLIECPRKRPGNDGKRIIFTQKLCDIVLHGSTCPVSRSVKDRKVINNRRVNVKLVNTGLDRQPARSGKRINEVLKSLLKVAEKKGIDELSQKRLFARCSTEIERLNTPSSIKNLIDWAYYGEKWPRMSFNEREGIVRSDIWPVLFPKENRKESPELIRALILKSLRGEE